jgi:hypothetical protein
MIVKRYFEKNPIEPEIKSVMKKAEPKVVKAATQYIEETVSTLHQINSAIVDIETLARKAYTDDDDTLYLKTMKELIRYYDLKAKLMGDIGNVKSTSTNTQNNVLIYIPSNGRD